jgi:hypothetical protein
MTKTPLILFSKSRLMKSKHHMSYNPNWMKGKINKILCKIVHQPSTVGIEIFK